MFALFKSKDAAESLRWADAEFRHVHHDPQKKELTLDIVDYMKTRLTFTFLVILPPTVNMRTAVKIDLAIALRGHFV